MEDSAVVLLLFSRGSTILIVLPILRPDYGGDESVIVIFLNSISECSDAVNDSVTNT